jgi:heme-degrading monooxygenase HmoA
MIRVLIERFFEEDMDEELRDLEMAARQQAMQLPGYISGETLKNRDNPQHNVVISTWRTVEEWNQWHASDARQSILEELRPILVEPEKITVLEPL